MTSSLPDNAFHLAGANSPSVPSLLQGMRAGAGSLFSRPLLLGSVVPNLIDQPLMAPMMAMGGPAVPEGVLAEWLANANAVEVAFRTTIGWVRSRLPGYPILRVPQLAEDTHLTTPYYSANIVWPEGERALGYQFLSAPPQVPELLKVSGAGSIALCEAAEELVRAFKLTEEWRTFADAQSALVGDDRAALQAGKKDLRVRLADDVDVPNLILERDRYLRQQAREVVAVLPDVARHYCEAFDRVNQLIEFAAGDVFGQLVAYGDPKTVSSQRIDLPEPGVVYIVVDSPFGHYPGGLIHLDEPLIADALCVEGAVGRFDILQLNPSTLSLRVLEGSAVWFEE